MAALNASEPSSQSGDVCVRLLLSGFTSVTSQLPAEMLSTAVRHGFFFSFCPCTLDVFEVSFSGFC